MNIPYKRRKLRISSSKSLNILWMMRLKFLQENPEFLMIYSITGTLIEES